VLILPGLTASAFASSIVYVKDSNVWLSSPDGSVTRQITTDGSAALPYFSPSQADDGTILAGLGTRLHRFDQSGRAVGAPIPTVLTNKPASMLAFGPFSPRISPDGTKVAYWIGVMSGSFDPACNCILSMSIEDVVYATTDGSGTIGFTRWNRSPSWIDNGRVLVFAPDNRQTPQAWIADLASPDTPQGWFNDDGAGFGGLIVNFDKGCSTARRSASPSCEE
jgi:Tol biopolymer transport system component